MFAFKHVTYLFCESLISTDPIQTAVSLSYMVLTVVFCPARVNVLFLFDFSFRFLNFTYSIPIKKKKTPYDDFGNS